MGQQPDPLSKRNPNVPAEWEALCMRMMEKRREARFQSITDLAIALANLSEHARAYEAFRTERAASGHSGSTMSLAADADRPTLLVNVTSGEHPAPASSSGEVPAPSGEPVIAFSVAGATAQATCTALLADKRHAAFARALISRPAGRWSEVTEVCSTANVAVPAVMPRDLHATWLDHPQRDQGLATVVFVSLDSEWCVAVPTMKPDR